MNIFARGLLKIISLSLVMSSTFFVLYAPFGVFRRPQSISGERRSEHRFGRVFYRSGNGSGRRFRRGNLSAVFAGGKRQFRTKGGAVCGAKRPSENGMGVSDGLFAFRFRDAPAILPSGGTVLRGGRGRCRWRFAAICRRFRCPAARRCRSSAGRRGCIGRWCRPGWRPG